MSLSVMFPPQSCWICHEPTTVKDKNGHPCLHSYHEECFRTVLFYFPSAAVKRSRCLVCLSLAYYIVLLQHRQSAKQHPQQLQPGSDFFRLLKRCTYQLCQVDLALTTHTRDGMVKAGEDMSLLIELVDKCKAYLGATFEEGHEVFPWFLHRKCDYDEKCNFYVCMPHVIANEVKMARRQMLGWMAGRDSTSLKSDQGGASILPVQSAQSSELSKNGVQTVKMVPTDDAARERGNEMGASVAGKEELIGEVIAPVEPKVEVDRAAAASKDEAEQQPQVAAAPQPQVPVSTPFPYVESREHLLPVLLPLVPAVIRKYCEPFVGVGTLFLQVLLGIDAGRIVVLEGVFVSDKNTRLMNAWQRLKDSPQEVIAAVDNRSSAYNALQPVSAQNVGRAKTEGSDAQRLLYNKWANEFRTGPLDVNNAALLIVLQHTNQLGLYSENKIGYNVKWGKGWLCNVDVDNLRRVAALIRKHSVQFKCCSFEAALDSVLPGSFVYFDPPRVGGYNSYLHSKFSMAKQKEIARLCQTKLVGSHFILSNSDNEWVKREFPPSEYGVILVVAPDTINPSAPRDTMVELIISDMAIDHGPGIPELLVKLKKRSDAAYAQAQGKEEASSVSKLEESQPSSVAGASLPQQDSAKKTCGRICKKTGEACKRGPGCKMNHGV